VLWRGETLPLREGENVLGRDEGLSVSLDEPSVSRRHARITVAGQLAFLEDLGSRNGTFVRGNRVDGPVPIEDGDAIRLGWARLVFCRPRRG
jgi:pSer/pThr/pTyr-binding forkhead associated (FHA) protein